MNFFRLLIFSLLIAPHFVVAQPAAPRSPREVASAFYSLVIREHLSGLPDNREMRLLNRYLSGSLRSFFRRARKTQVEAIRANPQEKPPWADGCLFSCSFEGPARFRLGESRISDRFAYVAVEQSAERNGNFEWTDTLVLVRENGRWLVWDVRMGCSWSFRMGPTLRVMLREK